MSYALELENLNKSYKAGSRALDDVSLKVEAGDFFALLGPNGAGKSTLISILSSLVQKDSGCVKIFGHDIDSDFAAAKRCLGIVPQEFNFNTFEKVRDIVINQAGFYGIRAARAAERADYLIEQLGLWPKRNEVSRYLSGGMKRRLMIARALVHKPKLLVLDEPTAGVDIELRRSLWQFVEQINAEGTSIILTTHYLEEAEALCRNVAIIDAGRIVKQSDMRSLLAGLQRESFVLDLSREPELASLPSYCDAKILEGVRLELSLAKGQALNELVLELDRQGCKVLSMRNKSNRLEELFVNLVGAGVEHV
ncbi:ABC transporter ATP-binding protein [Agaribacterium haliotis]|uniref:ABC transporter ATP-binding protein n=1 Tax=Agaribacterium haliotis TaxID=2013869 RepID=UPI000BB57A31|nr:ABC transporter ATP-binding protein [Agaribacterium haliotis]